MTKASTQDQIERCEAHRVSYSIDLAFSTLQLDAVQASLADPDFDGHARESALVGESELIAKVEELSANVRRMETRKRLLGHRLTRDAKASVDA